MRQRVALAMALVTSPSLIVLDEPTSALDLLTQANIMNVLKRIKQELGTSFILITHDIATSSELADEVRHHVRRPDRGKWATPVTSSRHRSIRTRKC